MAVVLLRSSKGPRSLHYSLESFLYEIHYFSHCPSLNNRGVTPSGPCPGTHSNSCSLGVALAPGLPGDITLWFLVFLPVSVGSRGKGNVGSSPDSTCDTILVVTSWDTPALSACVLGAHCG